MNRPQPVAINVAIGGLLSTGVALVAILWPARLTPEVQGLIIAFGNSLILTISVILATRQTTPVSSPMLPMGTPVLVERPAGAPLDQPPPDAVVALRPTEEAPLVGHP